MSVNKDLMDEAISRYGVDAQIEHQAEEASEVVTAFLQYRRDKQNTKKRGHLMEELVDNYLMATQMEYIFRYDESWKKYLALKQKKLRQRLDVKPSQGKSMGEIIEDFGGEWKK